MGVLLVLLVAGVAVAGVAATFGRRTEAEAPVRERVTSPPRDDNPARLTARPVGGGVPVPDRPAPEAGTRPLGQPGAGGRDGLLHVPAMAVAAMGEGRQVPLLVMFHGAGGSGSQALDIVRPVADELGIVVVAPDARRPTWDVIVGSWGPDVEVVDRALDDAFAAFPVDPDRIVVGGFSDGASYALSVGCANGDLFGRIAAFSPGFNAAPATTGRPQVFVSHGVQDAVLPIDRTTRVIVPRLRSAGYEVDVVEFPDGHVVPPELVRRGLVGSAA